MDSDLVAIDKHSTDPQTNTILATEKLREPGNRGPAVHGLIAPNSSSSPLNDRMPQQQNGSINPTMEKTEEPFPEGGKRAWLVVLGAWCGLLAALGITNTIAALQSYLATHQLTSYGEGRIGWIFSLYTFLSFFCGVYIGPLFDKYGPKLLVFIGSICLIGGLMLLSVCYEYWHFLLVFGIVNGVGCSLLFTPCLAAVSHFFRARRGLATGIASSGGSIGGIIFPVMLQKLTSKPSLGWPWALRILAFLCLFLVITANFFVRSRLPRSQNASIHPDISIFKNKVFLWTTVAVFLMEMALFIPLGYVSSYAIAQGFDENFSFQILMIMNAGSFFGRALPGWWADVIGPFNANMLSVLLSAIVCFTIWLPFGHTRLGIIVSAITIGFASGNNISITPVCIGKLCETQQYGRYYATCFTVVSLATLLGIPLGGNIITACEGSYWGLIVFTGCMYTASLFAFIIARGLGANWKLNTVF